MICKFEISSYGLNTIAMHPESEILSAHCINKQVFIWANCPDPPKHIIGKRHIYCYNTGDCVNKDYYIYKKRYIYKNLKFIGTVLCNGGVDVHHIFEDPNIR